jgi:hypothetical protein
MIRYVLGTKISCRSGRALARAIAAMQGSRCGYLERLPRGQATFMMRHVRFGSLIPTHGNSLNAESGVLAAANKELALDLMTGAGVSVPRHLSLTGTNFGDWHRPMIFRRSNRHGANDFPYIVRINDQLDVGRANTYDYVMQYLIKKKEYRVHSFCGQTVRIQQKRRKRGVEQNDAIRNLANGWVFCNIKNSEWCTLPEGLSALGVKAVQALGLDFGAADIIQDKHGKLYVLEVNTAPGLTSDDGVAVYASACVRWDRAN